MRNLLTSYDLHLFWSVSHENIDGTCGLHHHHKIGVRCICCIIYGIRHRCWWRDRVFRSKKMRLVLIRLPKRGIFHSHASQRINMAPIYHCNLIFYSIPGSSSSSLSAQVLRQREANPLWFHWSCSWQMMHLSWCWLQCFDLLEFRSTIWCFSWMTQGMAVSSHYYVEF